MKILIQYVQEHPEFRVPETLSLATLFGIKITFNAEEYRTDNPYLIVEMESVEDVRKLCSRAILIRSAYRLLAHAETYPEIIEQVNAIASQALDYGDLSWKFVVQSYGKSIPLKAQIERIERFKGFDLQGPIDVKNPALIFGVLEDFGYYLSRTVAPVDSELRRVFFGQWIADGDRTTMFQYDLKKRKYLGTTSMDPQLSLVMANQALAAPGKLILDPFVGTGSFLLTCAHFGAFTIGSDIDGRQLRGETKNCKGTEGITSNVDQYNLNRFVLDTLVCDTRHHPWRDDIKFDAIVTDPPYGIRAGAKTIMATTDDHAPYADCHTRHPRTENYDMVRVASDLVEFSAQYLKVGGRLVFWLPTVSDDYSPLDIPSHSWMKIQSDSEQNFGKWARRLITMEKFTETNEDVSSLMQNSDSPAHSKFQSVYWTKWRKGN